MDEQVQIFPSVKARLLCKYEKDDWPVIDQAIKDLPDDSLIITVGSNGFICKMGDINPNIYPVNVYIVSGIDSAYTVKSLKQIGLLKYRGEALAEKIVKLNESESLPDDILPEVVGFVIDCEKAAVEPIASYVILINFIGICVKKGMSFTNPFNTYTMNINNCYSITGKEAGHS